MTALLEYLDLLCDAWKAKLLHVKQKEQSFLTYLTHLIVLCVYPEKYTPLRIWLPGCPDLRTLLRWLRDACKINLSIESSVKSCEIVVYNT